ncbi:MAG: hypothetical protein CSYNP_02542 [Syntrophus sp. SKADARSKE-3]|nr:hypothetical protein [Syntrophus sp. SKADARSKE-3]
MKKYLLTVISLLCSFFIVAEGLAVNGIWTQKDNLGGAARSGAVGFSIGNKGYIGTGADGSSYYSDIWEYDPAADAWMRKADFGGAARSGAVGFSIGTKGYIGTGTDGSSVKQDFWEYDPATDAWTKKADFPGAARYGAVGFSIGGKGYIGTGANGSCNYGATGYTCPFYKDFWEYDPATDTWTQKADFGGPARFSAVGFSILNKGYVGTGFDTAISYRNDFWEYDPATNVWTQKMDFGGPSWSGVQFTMGTKRSGAVGFSVGTKGYITTGSYAPGMAGNARTEMGEYDPNTDIWTRKADFYSSRTGAVGFSIGGKGYVGTGLPTLSGSCYMDLWEFDSSKLTSLLYATYPGYGIYSWSNTNWIPQGVDPASGNWTQVNTNLSDNMLATDSTFYMTFTSAGLFQWNGSALKQINSVVPTGMTASGSKLYANFTGAGLWQWDGSIWNRINDAIPASMVASDLKLYANFAGSGLWQWDGNIWVRISDVIPVSMAASGSSLYANFIGVGLWQWNGNTWNLLNSTIPKIMALSGSNLYAAFADTGLNQWSGSAWNRINSAIPEDMTASGSTLYANFIGTGLWQWDGSSWANINADISTSMAASGSNLYATFTDPALWQWNGAGWSMINTATPADMATSGQNSQTIYTKDASGYDAYNWIYSNSVGSQNSIKITDMSGTLPAAGATIMVKAWDVGGNALPESANAPVLTLYNNGTTTVAGSELAARFPTGTPILYAISSNSPIYVATNTKISRDSVLDVSNGYTSGTSNFITNSVSSRNSIKISDMSGALTSSGASITVAAWDGSGNPIPESGGATPLKLNNNGTAIVAGADLVARFPTGSPVTYAFSVSSSKYVIANVKSSTNGVINIPFSYTSGTTNYVSNSIGSLNTIKITDVSGTLPSTGASITVNAWDADGNVLTPLANASPLTLTNNSTTTITGSSLTARFIGKPMMYEFVVGSGKYILTNTKNSMDGTIAIPYVYTSGTSNYVTNSVSSQTAIKITDISGSLSPSGATITVSAWDANGNSLLQSPNAAALTLSNHATTTITGTNLAARFPSGTPAAYSFNVGSTQYLITNLTANANGTINIVGST